VKRVNAGAFDDKAIPRLGVNRPDVGVTRVGRGWCQEGVRSVSTQPDGVCRRGEVDVAEQGAAFEGFDDRLRARHLAVAARSGAGRSRPAGLGVAEHVSVLPYDWKAFRAGGPFYHTPVDRTDEAAIGPRRGSV